MSGPRTVRTSHLAIIGLATTVAAAGLSGLVQPAAAAVCPQSGTTVTCLFTNAAQAESFVVPAGVTAAEITLRGGAGGDGSTAQSGTAGEGGAGGITTATVALTPGTSLGIYVGGRGGDGEGCVQENNGNPGRSGGIVTGGTGGRGLGPPGNPAVCAGGGGGGGSFVMLPGQTPSQIAFSGETSSGVTPVLVAGGGGGGGGGVATAGNGGGDGGGKSSGAAGNGAGATGGQAGSTTNAVGTDGEAGQSPGNPRDAGGGGGGGYPGGGGGGNTAQVAAGNDPGSGGGGGRGFPVAAVTPSVTSALEDAAAPARVVGPVTYGVAETNAPGSILITYTRAGSSPAGLTDSDNCIPDDKRSCKVNPLQGEETRFKIVGVGGKRNATIFATLNGGPAPQCKSVGGTLSPDWVQFGFANARAGKDWTKRVRVTGTDPTTKRKARVIRGQTQICFAAPYKFVVKRGTALKRLDGRRIWEGVLAHCDAKIIAQAAEERPKLSRVCILKRALVKKGDGWVVQILYRVPKGEEDPQGRSLRKKKKKRR